jgi:hypothetical protein
MDKYELDADREHENGHINKIQILTGLPDEEIFAVVPNRNIWYTRDYIQIFHQLGFNCNPKFQKFDINTVHPCLMRFKEIAKPNGYWYSLVYFDGLVYYGNGVFDTLDCFRVEHEEYHITSMLQVWL